MSDIVIVAILGVVGTLIGSGIGLFGGAIIESKRANNERKLHAQRVGFEYEFNLYKILAEKHLTMVYDVGAAVIISRGGKYPNIDSNKDFIALAAHHIDEADIENKRGAPFISKEIFEKYKELGELAFKAIHIFDLFCKFDELRMQATIYNGMPYTQLDAKRELESLQKDVSHMSDDILAQVRVHIHEMCGR